MNFNVSIFFRLRPKLKFMILKFHSFLKVFSILQVLVFNFYFLVMTEKLGHNMLKSAVTREMCNCGQCVKNEYTKDHAKVDFKINSKVFVRIV